MNLKGQLSADLAKRSADRTFWSSSLAQWESCNSGVGEHHHQATLGKLHLGMLGVFTKKGKLASVCKEMYRMNIDRLMNLDIRNILERYWRIHV